MPSERTSRRSGASLSSPVGACSSARRCGQSVGVQRDGMIDYAPTSGPEVQSVPSSSSLRRSAAISESGGTTEWLFTDLVEQRRCKKIRGAIVVGEAEGRESDQVSKIVGDLFEIGGATSRRVVAVLARRLGGNLPLTAYRLDVSIAKKFHRHIDLIGAWRKEILV